MHTALLSHPPRDGSAHGSITTQLIPSPDQPELQVHVDLPGPLYIQLAYQFIVAIGNNTRCKYLIVATSSVGFLTRIYRLAAKRTITTVPTLTSTPVKQKYYSEAIT